jgi:hypothetical protein
MHHRCKSFVEINYKYFCVPSGTQRIARRIVDSPPNPLSAAQSGGGKLTIPSIR